MQLGLRAVALSAVNTFEGSNSRKTCRETPNTKSKSSIAPAVYQSAGRPGREWGIERHPPCEFCPRPDAGGEGVLLIEGFTFPPNLKCSLRNKTRKEGPTAGDRAET